MNQLIREKSPYLLQHAHNPVDWMPWSEAAFERARREDKPIFLSIGYSTCHWCHVMERESFENEAVAQQMNQDFINIKVDREERPDVDRLYMTYVQATTGSGGWPMSVFLTPDLKPFFGGTYFPPRDAYGRIGFSSLLERIREAWQNDRAKIEQAGENVLQMLADYSELQPPAGSAQWDEIFDNCFEQFRQSFDNRYGGFGDAPKFPRAVTHDFLHRYSALRLDEEAGKMSDYTLRAMATGGMNDQLGGGFHRYSVDEQWIVSHFEEMLYDQAQLVLSYLEMFQLSGDERHAQTARGTLDYVLRDMTHPDGGFFSAEDADSLPEETAPHKEEGAFYVWTAQEIEAVLGAEAAAVFNEAYGVRPQGNAPRTGDPHGEFKGKNILFQAQTVEAVAKKFGRAVDEIVSLLEDARTKLFEARENRPRPHRDEKIIVAWNGLMISAFARAAQVLDEPRYLEAAQCAAAFVGRELFDSQINTLKRHFKDGAADVAGFADDYAFFINGLLDLFEASFDPAHLFRAEALMETLNRDFYDEANGGYFNSAPNPHVAIRMKEDYDGAEPSANSVAVLCALRLADLLDREDLKTRAEATLQLFVGRLSRAPHAMPAMLCAAMRFESPAFHIVLAAERDAPDTRALLQAVHQEFLPFKSLLLLNDSTRDALIARLPFVAEMKPQNGQAAAYVCRDFACRQPMTRVEELHAQLES